MNKNKFLLSFPEIIKRIKEDVDLLAIALSDAKEGKKWSKEERKIYKRLRGYISDFEKITEERFHGKVTDILSNNFPSEIIRLNKKEYIKLINHTSDELLKGLFVSLPKKIKGKK